MLELWHASHNAPDEIVAVPRQNESGITLGMNCWVQTSSTNISTALAYNWNATTTNTTTFTVQSIYDAIQAVRQYSVPTSYYGDYYWDNHGNNTYWTAGFVQPAAWMPCDTVPAPAEISVGAITEREHLANVAAQEERRLAREQRERAHRERIRARAAEMERAGERAEYLLDSLLNEEQRTEWKEQHSVTVQGPSGTRYRLDGGCMAGNVNVLEDSSNARVAVLCVHVDDDVPVVDNVVVQLLAIRFQESVFIGMANVHQGTLPAALEAFRAEWRAGRTQRRYRRILDEIQEEVA